MKQEKRVRVCYCGWEHQYLGTEAPWYLLGVSLTMWSHFFHAERQTLSRVQTEEHLGRDRVLAEWEGDAGHGAQGEEPLCTPGTPGPGGFTGRGARAQVRSETHLSFR